MKHLYIDGVRHYVHSIKEGRYGYSQVRVGVQSARVSAEHSLPTWWANDREQRASARTGGHVYMWCE